VPSSNTLAGDRRDVIEGLTFLRHGPRWHVILPLEVRHEQRHGYLPEPCEPPEDDIVLRHLTRLAIEGEPGIHRDRKSEILGVSLE
jgi:hypothetical protein